VNTRQQLEPALSILVKPAASLEPAEWIRGQLLPWGTEVGTRVCGIVPLGFEAYVRIFHPAFGPPPERRIVRWKSVAEWSGCVVHPEMQWGPLSVPNPDSGPRPWHEDPLFGWCTRELMVPLCERLAEHTASPESIWFAMWTGYADVNAVTRGMLSFRLPAREYVLLHGPLRAAGEVITGPVTQSGPSIWWPDDRAWCVATEVDFRWTYVGGKIACIESLELEPRLEVLRTLPQHRGDLYSDRVNGAIQP
jgi:hypothetical protein